MEENTILFTLRMPVEMREALKLRAKAERRDMTGHILFLLENDLRDNGYLPTNWNNSRPTEPTDINADCDEQE